MPEPKRDLRAWALALTATSTMAVSYVDRQSLAVLAPTVKTELGISSESYGWLISAFAIAYLVGAPLAGRMLDRVGARRGLLGAVLVWSAVAAAHALVPTFAALFALRIALGLAEAPSFPGAAQTVQRALPPEKRGLGFGILFCGSSFGAMIAPPLATYLAHRFSWRFAFVGTAIVGLSWVPIWLSVAFSRYGRERLDAKPDPAEASEPAPRALDVVKTPAVLRYIAVVMASAPFLNLMFNWGATYLVGDHHLTQTGVAKYLWFPPIFFDLGSILFGFAASRESKARGGLVPPRLLGLAAALAATGALIPFAGGPLTSMLVASVALAGGAGLYALATVDALARVPARAVATVSGIGAAAQSVAQIVVNPLIGRSVDATGHYTQIMMILGAWILPGTMLWLLWSPRHERVVQVA